MSAMGPRATVVIPTHNRAASIVATLAALDRQDCDKSTFEVIVVANACIDDTVARVSACRVSYALRVISIEAAGASLARNSGASNAHAAIVIFLDDDVTPEPSFVREHLAAHGSSASDSLEESRVVAVGYLPARLQPQRDRFAITLRGWWEAMFDRMRLPGHRFGYTDLLSGNFSMSRRRFLELGGFDTRLRCHEDYELGYRLIASGAEFVFVETASGVHTDLTRLPGACWRKREEGIADVYLAQRYPELRPFLLMARTRTTNQHIVRTLAFRYPAIGNCFTWALGRLLVPLEQVGAVAVWIRVVNGILGYWYERGLADALGTRAALDELLAAAPPESGDVKIMDVDLAPDPDESLRIVEAEGPSAVALRVGAAPIGTIPWRPGAERLRARHLAAALVRQYHRPYVQALVSQRYLSFGKLQRRQDGSAAEASTHPA
jgi:glycosyltransferase involved in cell wall biosynthesis